MIVASNRSDLVDDPPPESPSAPAAPSSTRRSVALAADGQPSRLPEYPTL
jgi:hypothetical protein